MKVTAILLLCLAVSSFAMTTRYRLKQTPPPPEYCWKKAAPDAADQSPACWGLKDKLVVDATNCATAKDCPPPEFCWRPAKPDAEDQSDDCWSNKNKLVVDDANCANAQKCPPPPKKESQAAFLQQEEDVEGEVEGELPPPPPREDDGTAPARFCWRPARREDAEQKPACWDHDTKAVVDGANCEEALWCPPPKKEGPAVFFQQEEDNGEGEVEGELPPPPPREDDGTAPARFCWRPARREDVEQKPACWDHDTKAVVDVANCAEALWCPPPRKEEQAVFLQQEEDNGEGEDDGDVPPPPQEGGEVPPPPQDGEKPTHCWKPARREDADQRPVCWNIVDRLIADAANCAEAKMCPPPPKKEEQPAFIQQEEDNGEGEDDGEDVPPPPPADDGTAPARFCWRPARREDADQRPVCWDHETRAVVDGANCEQARMCPPPKKEEQAAF